ncbi:hypothetical protein VTN31DRAFT_6108 [Thermomyces dupontii]|uniref:uncharacterized protein n=1 Tax=Talaromyces thermophilus TaxID=28565 RepID=UPI0037424206
MSKLLACLIYSTIPALILLYLLASPYTKIEESPTIDAVHDLLTYGIPSPRLSADAVREHFQTQYDHFRFPGPVPRSFIGPLILAAVAKPLVWLDENIDRQLLVRAVLGLFTAFALLSYAKGLQRAFGRPVAYWYLLFQASQFHIMYYASRPLANTLPLAISTWALQLLLPEPKASPETHRRRCQTALALLTVAGVIFRAELALFLATHTLYLLLTRRIGVWDTITAGIVGLAVGLTATVVVDSYFYQQFPLWPELTAFVFNVIEGESAAWGVSPWWYYFVSAVPRLLLNPCTYLVCIPAALVYVRAPALSLVAPSVAFIAIYSFLPHKEWRFIVYAVPPLTATAALGAGYLWTHRAKSAPFRALPTTVLPLSVLATLAVSLTLFLLPSVANYPGGHALRTLQQRAEGTQPHISVQLSNLACQTGATLFMSQPRFLGNTTWTFDKSDTVPPHRRPSSTPPRSSFDYIIAERHWLPDGEDDGLEWEVVDSTRAFAGVRLLRPGQDVDESEGCVLEDTIAAIAGEQGRAVYRFTRDILRKYLTRGYWVVLPLEEKLWILKNKNRVPLAAAALGSGARKVASSI